MYKRVFAALLAILILCAISISASAQDSNAFIESFAKEHAVHTYSIAFRQGTQPLAFINTDSATENTVFEVGSNGKMVAAYIVLKLVENGKLTLDSKIFPFLNEELLTDDANLQEITVKQLLLHTGGFSPSYEFGIDKNIYFEPGTKFQYSGVGYIYLQRIIEQVTGLSVESAAKEYVFIPLGMNDSTFEGAKTVMSYMVSSTAVLFSLLVFIASFIVLFSIGAILKRVMKGKIISLQRVFLITFVAAGVINAAFLLLYPLSVISKGIVIFIVYSLIAGLLLFITRKKKKLFYATFLGYTFLFVALGFGLNVTVPVPSNLVPGQANIAYSLKSTSKDMALFCEELLIRYNDGDSAISEMFQPAVVIDEQNSWGLGIAIENTQQGLTYWHSGINPSFHSLVVLSPANNSYVVVLTNSGKGLDFAKETSGKLLGINGVWDIQGHAEVSEN